MIRLELELARMIAQVGCPRSSTEGSFSRAGNSIDGHTEADVSVSVEIVFAAAVEASVCVDAVGVQATPAVVR